MTNPSQYRYPGVRPFGREQSNQFFGREVDVARFLSLLLHERLCVLYGKSGYGKSSLLNAGIQPKLDEKTANDGRRYVAIPVRFHAASGQDDENLLEQLDFHLENALRKAGIPLAADAGPVPLPETIWGMFKRWQADSNTVFVLLFDQFEELFSYPPEQQLAFRQQLSELLFADYPQFLEENEKWIDPEQKARLLEKVNAHAAFAIRSDRMSDLDRLRDYLPSILQKRFELGALARVDARQALLAPAKLPGMFASHTFEFESAAYNKILDTLQDKEKQIDPILLQILAESFERRSIKEGVRLFTADNLGDLNAVMARYYSDKIAAINFTYRNDVCKLCEESLVQAGNPPMRLSMHAVQIKDIYGISQQLLDQLVDERLLRAEAGKGGGTTYELPHDSLLGAVLEAKNKRLKEEKEAKDTQSRKSREQREIDENNNRTRERKDYVRRMKRAKRRSFVAGSLIFVSLLATLFAMKKTKEAKSLLEAAKLMAVHKLPKNFDALVPLDSLNCYHWELQSLSAEIEKLQNLRSMDLSTNYLAELPPEIGNLPKLQSLFLGYNGLKRLPPEIGKLRKLQALVLPSNKLKDLPPEFAQLQNLRGLDLRQNEFTALPIELFKQMPNLKWIVLQNRPGGTQLSESNISALRQAMPWCKIELKESKE